MNKTIVITRRQLAIAALLLVGVIAILSIDDAGAEVIDRQDLNCPTDGLVQHPCRQPDMLVTVKASHYWPPLGGTNCFSFVDGECKSGMASGLRWQDWTDKAAACPGSLPFGTIIEFNGRRFICLDRGGAVVQNENTYWIDTLTEWPVADYGSEHVASVWLPIWYR